MPMAKFDVDGANKLFVCKSGVVSFDVQVDLYGDWKEWSLEADNLKYEQALRTVGGDPLTEGRYLGDTYFLMNGWRIRPQEADHRLNINGNLYTEDGTDITVPATGHWNILIQQTVSNLIDSTVSSISPTLFVNELKASTWKHSQGTATKNFQDLMVELLTMTKGKIVNSQSGVFDFYDHDNSSILFTLVESGLQRLRQ